MPAYYQCQIKKRAVDIIRDLTSLCESGGFHLTKWMSNSRTVLASIPETERAKEVKDLDLGHNLPYLMREF